MADRISDHIETELFPGCPQVNIEKVLDTELTLKDAEVVTVKSKYKESGSAEMAIVKFTHQGAETPKTFGTSATVIVDKIKQVLDTDAFPLQGKVFKVEMSDDRFYYDIK